MRILYVYEYMPGNYQKYLFNLLRLLKSSLNVKTLVYKKDNTKADYYIKSYGFRDSLQRIFYKLKLTQFKSFDIQIFNKYDIIHVQHSYLYCKIIPLLNNGNSKKIVITMRGGDTYLKPWVDDKWQNFYKNQGNLIDAYITMSKNQKEYLMKWGISAEKIHVIPVSFGEFSKAKPKYANRHKLKLVSACRMTWEKNIEGSIRFVKLLKDKDIPFQYDVFGDGADLSELYFLIDKYGLQDNVNVKGKVENDKLKEILVKYDFFLQLSISEALSVSVLEAQSVGLPCVVSDSGGLKEAVIKGKTAVIYPYDQLELLLDETISIWKDREKYYSYSKNAINFVNNNFTTLHEENKLLELYRSLYQV